MISSIEIPSSSINGNIVDDHQIQFVDNPMNVFELFGCESNPGVIRGQGEGEEDFY